MCYVNNNKLNCYVSSKQSNVSIVIKWKEKQIKQNTKT